MIVARKYIENKPIETPNKRVKQPFNKQKANLLICSCALTISVIGLILCVSLDACNLIKPNVMANNIWFYVLISLYVVFNVCFICYNFKLFDFNVVFGYVATLIMLATTFVSIYILPNAVCSFLFGSLLLYFSCLTNFCFKDRTQKATSQFTLAHLFHFYIFVVAVMFTLVN